MVRFKLGLHCTMFFRVVDTIVYCKFISSSASLNTQSMLTYKVTTATIRKETASLIYSSNLSKNFLQEVIIQDRMGPKDSGRMPSWFISDFGLGLGRGHGCVDAYKRGL